MAHYHCSVKHGSKGNGASASAKCDYVDREGKYADKPDLEYKESGNMPEWAQSDPCSFWKASDKNERANARVYSEIEVALPREITADRRRELIQGFVKEHLDGHPYTVGIHNPDAALEGGKQPHAHIIFSERKSDGIERDKGHFFKRANKKEPEKGGCGKDRTWNDTGKVQEIRKSWEQHYNRYSIEQVSCLSLKDQGIDREPERHLGPKATQTEKNIINQERELNRINSEMEKLTNEIGEDLFNRVKSNMGKMQEYVDSQKPEAVNPSVVVVPASPATQSGALRPLKETNLPIQQHAVDSPAPAFTAAELLWHSVLRQIASIDAKIRAYVRNFDAGTINEERFNELTNPLDDKLQKLIVPYPGTELKLCPYEEPSTPLTVNGQPITELVKGLPPEQKPESQQAKPAPTQGIRGRS